MSKSTGYYCHDPAQPQICSICKRCETDLNYRRVIESIPRPAFDLPKKQSTIMFLKPKCPHLGERLEGQPCASTLYRCHLDQAVCSRYTPCVGADRVCQTCTLRPDEERVKQGQQRPAKYRWSYGVTTVSERRGNLLPKTLNSLKEAGFPTPRLFVDNSQDLPGWQREFDLEVTIRTSRLRTAGNWTLSLYELYIRNPEADMFAMFQDDFVTYKNLKEYLERCPYPVKGYWNLYTFPSNQEICPKEAGKDRVGWYKSRQTGRGAVALVFNKEAVITLLSQRHLVERVQDVHRGHKAVDGGIVTAMRAAGYSEYVHNPSLVQHTGTVSTMGNKPHKLAESFRGESFDALELLECPNRIVMA